ncbi:antitermination protein [Serratia proteamaculans]|uniref:antitermination protein n=1 Tax=Serratia proteamaculans TaxID=28151 RepID=UPI00101E93C3|nr:antitermination protein [Serratia proteamaculans]RYM50060.1 antitermination protein [Serratia proteamaculans]
MKLESALKHFSAQGLTITDTPNGTSADRVTGTDVMAALGMVESKASFGMAAFLGKTGISHEDRERAIAELTLHAMRKAPKHVGKVAGRRMARCMQILAALAYEDYSQSAGISVTCHDCNGKGLVDVERDVVTYPGYIGMDGEEKIAPMTKRQVVREMCQTCNGKGKIHKRCRNCKGTGKALDRVATKAAGVPVIKDCERCGSKGFSRMPSSVAHRAITALLPELTQSSWSRNWKPFYESLVAKCDIEEGVAASEFQKITK